MIMKNKYVLNIKGHVENNNSYYEEYNREPLHCPILLGT